MARLSIEIKPTPGARDKLYYKCSYVELRFQAPHSISLNKVLHNVYFLYLPIQLFLHKGGFLLNPGLFLTMFF